LFVGSQGLNVEVAHNFHNSFGFTLGGEYKLPVLNGLTIRAGLERISAPGPTDTVHPAIPDANSTAFCVGAGWSPVSNLEVNAGYKLAILDTITTTGSTAFPGTYNTVANFISAGASYKFDIGSGKKSDVK